jgi:glucokinase
MIGLELRRSDVLAVMVDNDGKVLDRRVAGGGDLSAAALAALAGLGPSGGDPPALAAFDPEAEPVAAAARAVARMCGGAPDRVAIVWSGAAAAAGEAWAGAARGKANVVYFAVGEHLTAGILVDGQPLGGVSRRAPAVGWLALNPVEREDYRKTGCLEAEVGGHGIVRRLVWRIKAGDRSRVEDAVGGDLTAITFGHIADAARGGDGVAISVMRDTAKYLGMAAANLAVVADPDVLVLGGIMASAADLLLETVRVEIGRRLPPAAISAMAVVPAALGDDAAAVGATRLAAALR